jgi:hypothetical protein
VWDGVASRQGCLHGRVGAHQAPRGPGVGSEPAGRHRHRRVALLLATALTGLLIGVVLTSTWVAREPDGDAGRSSPRAPEDGGDPGTATPDGQDDDAAGDDGEDAEDDGVLVAPEPVREAADGLWLSPAEIAALPTEGAAWESLLEVADDKLGKAKISKKNGDHNVRTLATALVYARTQEPSYRDKAAAGIEEAIGTEKGGRTLALGRQLPAYVIAADLIDLAAHDPDLDDEFRDWLDDVRTEELDGRTLISTHEDRPNNWGTHAGAARVAASLYLGDKADVAAAAGVFKGWLGDRSAYRGFRFGSDLSWQCDADVPRGVNPAGCTKDGHDVGGVLPDDQRRCDSFEWPPCTTNYAWEGLQGAVVTAELLQRRGFDAWEWEQQALRRAVEWLYEQAELPPEGDDTWQPWLVNHAYGTDFSAESPTQPGKNMGWTDWTHQRRR